MRHRVIWLVAAVLVTAVSAAGVVLAVFPGDDDAAAPAAVCDPVTPPPSQPAGDGGVVIAERGHTRVASRATTVSMGVVLRNTSAKVAYRTRVKFVVRNRAGANVVWETQKSFQVQEVPIILPGATVAVGNALALSPAARGNPAAVSAVEITAKVSGWLDPGGAGLGAVTSTVVAGGDAVSYTTDNANCAPMTGRGVSMVFRDAAGRIVGGSLDTAAAPHACAPGHSTDRATATPWSVPATADLARTEVTAYCDHTPPGPPSGVDAPVN